MNKKYAVLMIDPAFGRDGDLFFRRWFVVEASCHEEAVKKAPLVDPDFEDGQEVVEVMDLGDLETMKRKLDDFSSES